jgi:hypothetical protein
VELAEVILGGACEPKIKDSFLICSLLHAITLHPIIMDGFDGFEMEPRDYLPTFVTPNLDTYRSPSDHRPSYGRNDIRKSMESDLTRKDIRRSVQLEPTSKDSQIITPPENVERETNTVLPHVDSVDKAYDFVTRFNSWHSGKLTLPDPNVFEKNFVTPMTTEKWIKLKDKLKLSESDDKSVYPCKNSLPVFT